MRNWYSRKRFRPLSFLRVGGSLALLLTVLVGVGTAHAQGFLVRGYVLASDGSVPIPGANVIEVGTQTGTTTDLDGAFEFNVSGPNAVIAASFVGYETQQINVGGQRDITFLLEEDTAILDDVVVTAFGIEREQKALGYSVSNVTGEELREAGETNVANALAGKVAGVLVQKPASGPAGSSRVIIRGVTSLGAGDDNQPLYVVDGVPIDNSNLGNAGMWGGSDGGDGISSLNPDDIESMSVLKGAAAAALYGTRAKNGVILITTKKAQRGTGLGVEFSSNLTFEDVLVDTDFQTDYGQGARGLKPTSVDEAVETNQSAWGAPLDGSMVVQWDGVERPYSLVDDNVRSFYDTGLTSTNTLALTAGTDNTAVRLSMSHLENAGISPNSGLSRTTFLLRGSADFGSRLSADAKLNFIREDVKNRPRLSDSPGNANYSVYVLAPNVDVENMRCPDGGSGCDEPGRAEDGTELHPFSNSFTQNPYFAAYQFRAEDLEQRLIGTTSLRYKFAEWLSLQGRVGLDTYTTRRTNVEPWGTAYIPLGSMSEQEFRISELNTDFLFFADRRLTPSIGLSANFGGNIMYRKNETLTLAGSGGFNVPNLETVGNLATPRTGYGFGEKQVNSLYGQAEVSYNDYVYLTATGRNDWSSTLPDDNNSYFYPSVALSVVFSDALEMPDWLSFGKVRASWAEVGGDTDPYRLLLTYGLAGGGHLGRPYGGVAQGEIPLATLKPTSTVETELGFNLQFLDNRFGLDLAWYDKTTSDQILATTISSTSGFGSQVINAGEIRNTGVELLLTTSPVLTNDWRWDLNFNFARNSNEVVELIEGQETLILAESRRRGNFVTADVGEPYGTIKGRAYLRDDQGRLVFDDAGLPLPTSDIEVLGNGTPDWIGGVSSTVRFRRFTLNTLVDMRFGGEIFSALNSFAYGAGLHRETLDGREVTVDDDGNVTSGGIVGQGVSFSSCTEREDGTLANCSANTTAATPWEYYGRVASQIGEEFVYDASFVKLREVELTYRLPEKLFRGTPVQLMTVSLVGRNLWLIYSDIPNIDPESSFRNDSQGIGLEHSGVPQTRSFGFNLNVRL